MNNLLGPSQDTGGVQFWNNPECEGWLEKQGTWLRSWRRRWFVLKDGKMIWFKTNIVTPVSSCLAIKGAEDSSVCNGKAHAFEISIQGSGSQFFVAPSTQEKEAWINAVGQAIVRQSRSALREEYTDYSTGK